MAKNIIDEFVTAAEKDAAEIVNNFVRKNKISLEKGKKILNKFLKSTKPIRKQAVKMAKRNISGRIRHARQALEMLDKGLGLFERNLRKPG